MSFLRSLLISTPLIVLSTIVMGTLSLLGSFFDRTGNGLHYFARIWGKMLLAASFIRVRTDGLEKLDPQGTYIFVSNHVSYMDIPAILSQLPQQFRFFAKKGLFKIPLLGTHLRRAGHLPVDRESPRARIKAMSEAAKMIGERGTCMLIFPEGGRCPEGLRAFNEGAAFIAIRAGVPVVPMALIGMREKLPMESIHIRTGKVTLRIGDPIPTTGMVLADREALTKRLYQEISTLLG